MNYIFAGDSWALKAFTQSNYHYTGDTPDADDIRLADFWGIDYILRLSSGKGNLSVMNKILDTLPSSDIPIIWLWTEPGRDYGTVTGRPEFEWMTREDIFQVRDEISETVLKEIKKNIKNPIALIGGLSDVDKSLAESLEFTVFHPSWQQWIAEKLNSQWFKLGWGACDIGWRTNYNNVIPSKTATFAWDDQIKEWCWWEEHGYFCHEHPSPKANEEFALFLKDEVIDWLGKHEQR